MPFTEVIETAEVAPGLLEEPIHGFLMRGRITAHTDAKDRHPLTERPQADQDAGMGERAARGADYGIKGSCPGRWCKSLASYAVSGG